MQAKLLCIWKSIIKIKMAKGKAWFDEVQLEKGEVSSSYNPVQNSSFTSATENWNVSGASVDSEEGFNDDVSLKAARTSASQAGSVTKQTVVLGQSANDKPVYLTLTGMSKASSVKFTDEKTILCRRMSLTLTAAQASTMRNSLLEHRNGTEQLSSSLKQSRSIKSISVFCSKRVRQAQSGLMISV